MAETQPPTGPVPRRRRWRRLIWLSGVVVLLAAFGSGFFPQEPLRRLAEWQLQKRLGPGWRIGQLRIVPALLDARATDIRVETPALSVSVAAARLDLGAASLFGKTLLLDALELHQPRVTVRAGGPQTSKPATFARSIEVRRVLVTDGELLIVDGDGTLVKLSGLGAHGSVGRGTLEIEAREGVVAGQPLSGALGSLRVSPALDVTIDALEARSGRSRIQVAGSVKRLLERPLADLRFAADVELADLTSVPRRSIAGHVRADGTLSGSDASDLRAEARLTARALSVSSIAVDGATAHVKHAPETGTDLRAEAGLLSGRVELDARLHEARLDAHLALAGLALERLPRNLVGSGAPQRGRLFGNLTARGRLTSVRVDGRADVEAAWAALPAMRLALDLAGSVNTERRSVDLAWTLEAAAQGSPRDQVGLRSGEVVARGTSVGTWPPRTLVDLVGRARLATPTGESSATLSGQGQIDGDSASGQVVADVAGGHVTLDALVSARHARRLELVARGIDLGALAPDLAGRLDVQASASGPLSRLRHTGRLEARGLVWRGAAFGDVTLDDRGEGRLATVTLLAPALGVTATAKTEQRAPHVAQIEATFADTPLEPFAPLAGRPLEGQLSGRLEASVPLDQPRRAVASLRLDTGRAESGELSASLTAPFVARWENERLLVEALSLAAPGMQIDVQGGSGWTGQSPLDARIRLAFDLGQISRPRGWAAAGRIEGEVALSGSPERPQAQGELRLTGVSLAAASWPTVQVPQGTIGLAGDRILFESLAAQIGDGRIEVTGALPFAALPGMTDSLGHGGSEADLTIRFSQLEVEPWLAAARPAPGRARVSGAVSGTARIAGRLRSLAEIRSTLDIEATTLATGDVGVDVSPFKVELSAGLLDLAKLHLASGEGAIDIGGQVDLVRRTLDLSARGVADLRALSPFLKTMGLTGAADGHLTATGTFAAPVVSGGLTLKGATVRARAFGQPLTDLDARLTFDRSQIRIESATARLGGGTLTGSGGARLSGAGLTAVDLTVAGRDVALHYPPGLWSRLNADLKLTGQSRAWLLGGTIHATSGIYTEDLATEETLLAPVPVAVVSPALRAIRLDLELVTDNPIRVRNDVARLEATGRLIIKGDMETPQVLGHLDVLTPGGRVFLQGLEFSVVSGRLSYEGSWVPVLSLTGTTSLKHDRRQSTYTVEGEREGEGEGGPTGQVRATGDEGLVTAEVTAVAHGTSLEIMNAWAARLAGNTDPSLDATLKLTSDTGLSATELASFLATGRSQEALRGQEIRSLGVQAATLVATRLATGAARGLSGLGLDEVRIQPELLGREGDQGARFTFGKRLTPYARLVYSRGLANAEESFFDLQVEPGWRLLLSLKRLDDGLFVYGVGQRLTFGGRRAVRAAPSPTSRERTRLTEVRLEGSPELPRDMLAQHVQAQPGRVMTPWDLQDDAERLRRWLAKERHLTADVVAALAGDAAVFTVNAGPRYRIEVLGMDRPPSLERPLAQLLYEEEARERGERVLLDTLRARGYLTASVELEVVPAPAAPGDAGLTERVLRFRVQPGPRYGSQKVTFPGATSISQGRLLGAAGGAAELIVSPDEAVARVTALYRARNFLEAQIGPVSADLRAEGVTIEVPVKEGPTAHIAAVRFEGASLPSDELAGAAALGVGEPYSDERLLTALGRLRDHYLTLGKNSVRIAMRLEPREPDLEIVFTIEEGDVITIAGIEVRGAAGALERRVRKEIGLKAGDPLDPRALARAERRLLDLPGVGGARVTATSANPATVVVEVDRAPWARAGYDLRYDDESGVGGLVDGELVEIGRWGSLGGRYRVAGDVRELRASLHSRLLGGRGLTASVSRLTEDLAPSPDLTQRSQTGFEIQQALRLPNRWSLLAGYTFKRVTVTSFSPVDLGALDVSLMRESRDNPMDASRGRFLSLNVELSHPRLASTTSFVKGFGQALFARALTSHIVWAQGYRLGLAHVFPGGPLLAFERFRAGGANSVRGFETDAIGPLGFNDAPLGGQAVFVVNQELRYRHATGLGLAAFYDLGNVFPTVRDVRLSARHSVGVGLRWASPFGLVRFDMAWPLSPRPGEPHRRSMFSIGQAF